MAGANLALHLAAQALLLTVTACNARSFWQWVLERDERP